jgi:hypothetical protein
MSDIVDRLDYLCLEHLGKGSPINEGWPPGTCGRCGEPSAAAEIERLRAAAVTSDTEIERWRALVDGGPCEWHEDYLWQKYKLDLAFTKWREARKP